MNYGFFDYKYNILGYSGQDFDSAIRFIYLALSVIAIPQLAALTGRKGEKNAERIFRFLSVYLIIEEVFKISWESYWDIRTGRGFNAGGILPLDTCSIFLYLLPVAAYGRGKARRCALAWISTIGVLGGLSYMLFPMALKWYPLFSFGAWHSLMYHFVMVYAGVTAVSSGMLEVERRDALYGYLPHVIMASAVIPLDYLFGWDYMLLKDASGIPFIEDMASKLSAAGLGGVTTVIMMLLYLACAELFTCINIHVQRTLDCHGLLHHERAAGLRAG